MATEIKRDEKTALNDWVWKASDADNFTSEDGSVRLHRSMIIHEAYSHMSGGGSITAEYSPAEDFPMRPLFGGLLDMLADGDTTIPRSELPLYLPAGAIIRITTAGAGARRYVGMAVTQAIKGNM